MDFDYLVAAPRCRKVNIGEALLQLSPWHRQKREESLLNQFNS